MLKKLAKKHVRAKVQTPEIDHYAGTRGYAQDVKRDLLARGLFDSNGDFVVERFEKGLRDGTVDIMVFK